MEHIWAPWRMKYIESEKSGGCVLCEKPAQKDDDKNFLLYRGEHNYVMLNLYPYINGHLLIAPIRHVGDLAELCSDERSELMEVVELGVRALRKAYDPMGFNVGMNIGKVAGAGVADHVHIHVVPRWQGDTSFLTVVSGTRVLCQDLSRTFELLKGIFRSLTE